ncbi:MAG: ATP-binding protein, partial [Candidatus Omnitrophota bacterium]
MVKRALLIEKLQKALGRSRIVGLIGPRQCGKTTLAQELVKNNSPNYFDLEDPESLARLKEPMTALRDLKGLIVIDEVQRRPDLFQILRVLADRRPLPARFLILGSASPELLRQSSESLAGRIEVVPMGGFSAEEIGIKNRERHWLRGSFPLSYLAASDQNSFTWRKSFVQTFLERDIPQFGFRIPAIALLRFWTMLAHYHGQIWNAAEPARSLGISESSVRRHLDLLTDVFMVKQLRPWHANLKKRQVKAPKIYLRDSGILHYLLGLRSTHDLLSHPKSGASWEGYVLEEVIRAIEPDEVYFWATHNGAEIDLVLLKYGKRYGVECKRQDAPVLTPSMKIALSDLKLERIAVIYPGKRHYELAKHITVVPFEAVLGGPAEIF